MGDLDALSPDALRRIDQSLTGILSDDGDLVRTAEAGVTFVRHDTGEAQPRQQ